MLLRSARSSLFLHAPRLRPKHGHTHPAWQIHTQITALTGTGQHLGGPRSASEQQVPIPLCTREPSAVEELSGLLSWRDDVLQRIQAVGDTFETQDGGPGRALLEREVTWALDDAVAAYREAPGAAWLPCTWQQLEQEMRFAQARRQRQQGGDASAAGGGGGGGGATEGWQVQLRASVAELRELWRQRLEGRVPFQYLINAAHWREFVLAVGPGVLVPRPETEQMIDMAAAAVDADPRLAAAPWADLGTGSGALAVGLGALLRERRSRPAGVRWRGGEEAEGGQAQAAQDAEPAVWAVDLSPVAAAYAAANAGAAAPPGSVRVVTGSWWAPLEALRGRLGGVLTNPPYIPKAQMEGLQREVGVHEPHSALDGGPGPGLDSIQEICAGAGDMLIPGGYIAIETAGDEQAAQVVALLEGSAQFEGARVVADCFGVGRFVEARRRR